MPVVFKWEWDQGGKFEPHFKLEEKVINIVMNKAGSRNFVTSQPFKSLPSNIFKISQHEKKVRTTVHVKSLVGSFDELKKL